MESSYIGTIHSYATFPISNFLHSPSSIVHPSSLIYLLFTYLSSNNIQKSPTSPLIQVLTEILPTGRRHPGPRGRNIPIRVSQAIQRRLLERRRRRQTLSKSPIQIPKIARCAFGEIGSSEIRGGGIFENLGGVGLAVDVAEAVEGHVAEPFGGVDGFGLSEPDVTI